MADNKQIQMLFALFMFALGILNIYLGCDVIFVNNGFTGMFCETYMGTTTCNDTLFSFMVHKPYHTTLQLAFVVFFISGIFNIITGIKVWRAVFRNETL